MGLGCLGMAGFKGLWALYGVTAFYGLGYGSVWPMYGSAASDLFPKRLAGSVVGLWTLLLGIGSIVSPVLCGWIIDVSNNYTWVFILGLLSGMISSVLLLPLLAKSPRSS
jgi:MFS family permease